MLVKILQKNYTTFIVFLLIYILLTFVFGKFGQTFAFNVDHFLTPIHIKNIDNILKNFVYYDEFTGYNFAKVFQIIPSIYNLIFTKIDYLVNGKQTSAIFISFYFINFSCFYLLFKNLKYEKVDNILYSILFSTSSVLTCSICLGFTNLNYIISFFPFLFGWCFNKLDNKYGYIYFLLTLGNIAMFVFSILFYILFCEKKKNKYLNLIKVISPNIIILLIYVLLIEQNPTEFAIQKNDHSIFSSNRPIYTFFNFGFMDRANQILTFNYLIFFVIIFYLLFYRSLFLQFKNNQLSKKTKISILFFLLVILYMIFGIIFPDFVNLLYKNLPGLIIFRGQYLFNIIGFVFFVYFFINSKTCLEKKILAYILIFFQLTNIISLFFNPSHLSGNLKNFHFTNYNYYDGLEKNLNLSNNNIFFPLVITNEVREPLGNIRNGTGYNYQIGTFNPLIINEFINKNDFEKTLRNFNFDKVIVVKKDINLKNDLKQNFALDKIFENEDFIIYQNKFYKKKEKCKFDFNYYNCIKNNNKNNPDNKLHESTNFENLKTYKLYLFHLITIFLIFSTLSVLIKIFFKKDEIENI